MPLCQKCGLTELSNFKLDMPMQKSSPWPARSCLDSSTWAHMCDLSFSWWLVHYNFEK